jgi:hypothetical protein
MGNDKRDSATDERGCFEKLFGADMNASSDIPLSVRRYVSRIKRLAWIAGVGLIIAALAAITAPTIFERVANQVLTRGLTDRPQRQNGSIGRSSSQILIATACSGGATSSSEAHNGHTGEH